MLNRGIYRTVLTLVVVAGSLATIPDCAQAKDKYDMSSRAQEANTECRNFILSTAKDPDSVSFPEDGFGLTLGRVVMRNHIYITNVVYGKNTYGAVLKHNIVCDAVCKQGEPCQVIETNDWN